MIGPSDEGTSMVSGGQTLPRRVRHITEHKVIFKLLFEAGRRRS
jgi:hypothetical protein